jgi:hypothetical protein
MPYIFWMMLGTRASVNVYGPSNSTFGKAIRNDTHSAQRNVASGNLGNTIRHWFGDLAFINPWVY